MGWLRRNRGLSFIIYTGDLISEAPHKCLTQGGLIRYSGSMNTNEILAMYAMYPNRLFRTDITPSDATILTSEEEERIASILSRHGSHLVGITYTDSSGNPRVVLYTRVPLSEDAQDEVAESLGDLRPVFIIAETL